MAQELFNPTELMGVLQDLARDVKDNYKEHLELHGRRASGTLLDSIYTQVEVRGSRYIVWINMADYWKFVEEDTKPHWPPLDAILSWIRVKPIIPRPDANGKIPTPATLAFLIGRAMAGKSPNQANCKNPQGGTTGTHDLRDTERAVIPMYVERLQEALHRDTLIFLEKILP